MKESVRFITKYLMTLVLGVFFSIVLWLYKPTDSLPVSVFLYITMPLAVLCVYLIEVQVLSFIKGDRQINSMPKLKLIKDDLYIFEPSNVFSTQSFVSLFYVDDAERFVGWGVVETVLQTTGNLQISLKGFARGYSNGFLVENKNSIVIKPTVPYEVLGAALQYHLQQGGNAEDENNEE